MIHQLVSLFLDHDRFVVTTHTRPDGDALGSQLALGHFLRKLGKEVHLINTDAPPYNLSWMPGTDAVEVFDGALRQLEILAGAEVIVVLDTNTEERLGKMGAAVRSSPAVKVLIDHHPTPESWFDLQYRRESASSTGELVYELIVAHDPGLIDAALATALYVAIMTDTGSFRYSSTTAEVHRIVADLLERGGIEPAPIHAAIFDTRSVEGLRLLSRTLDTLSLRYGGQLGYLVVPQRTLREIGADVQETEGFVNYVLSIEGVRVALLFIETERGTKVSFRSKGDAYVHEWAQHFGGGGHRNASGAFVRKGLEETIREVVDAAPRFIDFGPETATAGCGAAGRAPDDGVLSPEDEAYLASLLDLKSRNA
ncbi:bifunctional oligoribonuclease/PAP phosphatase NrnA [Rhodocaloribacter litoris]|uniref:DHH family phosphoesterase n=1 Tax=Rhodocaloribacter litoris TaxID=2558931 RepID=UPI00142255F7|nr:bifunctional oligoribonuclease/PAP phosphatase NrnA [Rhodocaloribacter litoris]QXD15659.1 bifunctional oligoribonuclease/PAP phosphatase NrnA [Rhodocaloribacter litoris]GIV61591.1 MAG: DHH family phosphoesterase [Rhodothermaceae bacterium]